MPAFRPRFELDPKLPLARKKLGQALAALGRGAEADKAFESWFEQDVRTAPTSRSHSITCAPGRKDDAIATLKARLRINPDNVDAMHTLAQACWGDDQRLSDIEALLRRVTHSRRDTWLPGCCSARCSMARTGPKEAIACYQRATELAPGNAAAWSGLGADYAQIGDMEKSSAAYAQVRSPCSPACRAST